VFISKANIQINIAHNNKAILIMETTLAILLYLHLICPCAYTQQNLDAIILQNQATILLIESDPALTHQIEIDYDLQVDNIVIIDPDEL
jgi:hypothetical protein